MRDQDREEIGELFGVIGSYTADDENKKTILCCNKILVLKSNSTLALGMRANAYWRLGYPKKAMQDRDKIIELQPTDALGWSGRGRLKLKTGQYKSASKDFDKALSLEGFESSRTDIMLQRGTAKRALKLYDEASIDFDFVLNSKPGSGVCDDVNHQSAITRAWMERGILNQNLGRHDEALLDFNKAIELSILYYKKIVIAVLRYRALTYKALGRYEEAIEDLKAELQRLIKDQRPTSDDIHLKKEIEELKRELKKLETSSHARSIPPKTVPQSVSPSAPPAGTQTLQNIVVPSAPQNSQSYYAPPPRIPPPTLQSLRASNTRNLAPSAPVMGAQTQEFLAQRSYSTSNNFDEIALDNNQIIAKGGFGVVYRAQWNQLIVAVKTTNNFEQLDSIKKEYSMLSELQHPNLVHIHGCFARNDIGFCLVMDFYVNGSLNQYLYAPQIWNNTISWRLRCGIEVTQGLVFLHENNLLHLDLKPENVLVREDWHVVITDFGISRKLAMNQTHQTTVSAMGTPAFTAPEIIMPKNSDGKTRYDKSNDIYSLAMLLWCCATEKTPFAGWDHLRVVTAVAIKKEREKIPKEIPKKLAHLIKGCWSHNPSSRPTAAKASAELNEIYAKEIRDPNKNSFPTRK
jgi:tetratricopeptide (TPR) repeat protein